MQRTPLRRKTGLKSKTPLTQYTSLKAQKPLATYSQLKTVVPLKSKQKTARKRKDPYFSVFTDNMHRCIITGAETNVDPHHIFSASRKEFSEKYGFMIPLRRDWHEGTEYSIHQDRDLELEWKIRCQEYWIHVLGKTKEEWLAECKKWYVKKAA